MARALQPQPSGPQSITTRGGGEWSVGVSHDTRRHTIFGFGFLFAMFAGFGGWAATAPIAGAIVTSGSFVATGQNKALQHLEGGIIQEIRAKDGDLVEPGQVLMRLDRTAPEAELHRLTLRQDRLDAIEARLEAEGHNDSALRFPAGLLGRASDPDVANVMMQQRLTFEARRRNLDSDLAVLEEGITAIDAKIKGTLVQRAATVRQLDFYKQELDAKQFLLNQGEIRRSEVLAIQRATANAEGEIGRLDGDIGDARERIARIREQIQGARATVVKTAMEQLQDNLSEQTDVRERIRASRATLDRVAVVAPVRGIVVKMHYHTPGGVVEAGKTILEIVPLQDELVIEAHIRPQDIDHVKQGQSAAVRLTALSQRLTPMVDGEVIYVSADALQDDKRPMNGGDFYVARIKLDAKQAPELRHFAPTPGMPAEVYIKTAERTFFDYLTKPIRDSMAHAFREI